MRHLGMGVYFYQPFGPMAYPYITLPVPLYGIDVAGQGGIGRIFYLVTVYIQFLSAPSSW